MFLHAIAALFFTLIPPSLATTNYGPRTVEIPLSNHEKEVRFLLREDGQTIYERIRIGADGWQDSLEKKTTKDETLANEWAKEFDALLTRYSPLSDAEPRALKNIREDSLWVATENWSDAWETRYSDWLKREFDPDFFKRHGVATDCADVAYAARWIFARIHALPMANRLSAGALFTNRTVRAEWRSLPTNTDWSKDRKFMAGLNYLLNQTYTHSLMRDSFPVAIRPGTLLAGAYHLSLGDESGHTQLVTTVEPSNPTALPILIQESTIPRDVRSLNLRPFSNSDPSIVGKKALLRMLWPTLAPTGEPNGLVAADAMPGYSLEQFEPNFMRNEENGFAIEVYLRLNPALNFENVLMATLEAVKALYQARVQIVVDGYAACGVNACAPDSGEYDLWSTPSRDGRINDQFAQVERVTYVLPASERETVMARYETALNEKFLTVLGKPVSLKELREVWKKKFYSSNPNHPVAERWAVTPEGMLGFMTRTLTEKLAERTTKLDAQGTICDRAENCVQGSENFLRFETSEEDLAIQLLAPSPSAYCDIFDSESCHELRARITSTPFSIDGRTRPLAEWIREFTFFNSDPRTARSERIGSHQNALRLLEITGKNDLIATPSGLLYASQDDTPGMFYRIDGNRPILISPTDANATFIAFDRAQEAAWEKSARQVRLLKSDLTEIGAVDLALSPNTKVLSIGDRKLLLKDGSRVVFIAPNSAGAVTILFDRRIEIVAPEGVSSDSRFRSIMIAKDTDGETRIFDFERGFGTAIELPFVDADFAASTSKHLFIQAKSSSTDPTSIFAYARADGSWKKVFEGFTALALISDDESQALVSKIRDDMNHYSKLELGANLEAVNREELGFDVWNVGNFRFFGDYADIQGTAKRFAEMPDRKLVKVVEQTDEAWIKHIQGRYVITQLKDREILRLRTIDGTQVLHEGKAIAFPVQPSQGSDLRCLITEFAKRGFRLFDRTRPEIASLMTGLLINSYNSEPSINSSWYLTGLDQKKFQIERGCIFQMSDRVFWMD